MPGSPTQPRGTAEPRGAPRQCQEGCPPSALPPRGLFGAVPVMGLEKMPRACVSSTHLMSKPFFLPERLGVSKAPVLPAGPGAEPAAPGRAADSLVAAEDTQQVLGAEIRGEVIDLDDMGQLVIAEVRRGRLGPVVVEAGLLQALPALLAPRELRGGRGTVLSDPGTSTSAWWTASTAQALTPVPHTSRAAGLTAAGLWEPATRTLTPRGCFSH